MPAAVLLAVAAIAVAASSPTVTTGTHSKVTDTSAVLHGTVNPNGESTTYFFRYGKTTSYELGSTASQSAGSGTSGVSVSAALSGLQAGTQYHFQLVATDAAGTSQGTDATFTTTGPAPPPPPPPAATTTAATTVSQTGATLNGTVNPNGSPTTYHFDYGTTPGLGLSTASVDAGSGTSPVTASAVVGNLTAGTTYYFRVVADASGGVVTNGQILTFTTQPSSGASGGGGGGGSGTSGGGTGGTTTGTTTTTTTTTPPPSTTTSTSPSGTTTAFAPLFTLALTRQRPSDVLRRGLVLTARCRTACRLDAAAYLSGADARRLGLSRTARNYLVGTATASVLASGQRRLVVRLRTAARRALARSRTVTLLVRVRSRDATGRAVRLRGYRIVLRSAGISPLLRALVAIPASTGAGLGLPAGLFA